MPEDIRQRIIFEDAQSIGTINDITKALQILKGQSDGTQSAMIQMATAAGKRFGEQDDILRKNSKEIAAVAGQIKNLGGQYVTLAGKVKPAESAFTRLIKAVKSSKDNVSGIVQALRLAGDIIKGVAKAVYNLGRSNAAVAEQQDKVSKKWRELQEVVSSKLGPVFNQFFSGLEKNLSKIIDFVSSLSDAFGPRLAANISGSRAVVKAFFENTGVFIQRTVNGLEILGKKTQLAFTIDPKKRAGLVSDLEKLRDQNNDLKESYQDLGQVFNETFNQVYTSELAKVQAGTYKQSKRQADEFAKQSAKALKDAKDHLKDLQTAYTAAAKELSDQLQDSQLELMSEPQRLIAVYQMAIKKLDGTKETLSKNAEDQIKELRKILKGPALEKAIADVNQKVAEQISFIEPLKENLRLGLEEALKELGVVGKQYVPELVQSVKFKASRNQLDGFAENDVRGLQNAGQQYLDNLDLSPLERFKGKVQDALGLTDEEFDLAYKSTFDNLGSIINSTFQSWNANIDLQLAKNQELITSIREQRDVVKSALEEETKKREEGYAANVESKQRELEELDKQEQAALIKKEQLEKKRLRAQLIQDSLSQASSMATGAANILNAETKNKGLIGVLLAISAIALMFKIFASAKANAAKAAQSTKAYKGGKVSDYLNPGTAGRTDRFGGEGHQVSDTNMVIGADEFIMNAETTKAQESFLRKLNSGKYDRVNIESLIDHQAKSRIPVETVVNSYLNKPSQHKEQNVLSPNNIVLKTFLSESIKEQTDRILSYLKNERPVIIPKVGEGYRKEYYRRKEDVDFKD